MRNFEEALNCRALVNFLNSFSDSPAIFQYINTLRCALGSLSKLKLKDMNLLQFMKEFQTEESCKHHFRNHREKEGVGGKQCGREVHWTDIGSR